jgi:hypothetical protein
MKIDDYDFLLDKTRFSFVEAEGYGLVYVGENSFTCWERNNEVFEIEDLLNKNLRSPSLGYFKVGGKENDVYVTRIPGRFYRVGLYHRNTEPGYLLEGGGQAQADCLLAVKRKDYPNFKDAWKEAKRIGRVKAFSKRYAVSPRTLQFRGQSLGKIVENTVEFSSQEEVDFHWANLVSLDFDLELKVAEKKFKKEPDPFEEDV